MQNIIDRDYEIVRHAHKQHRCMYLVMFRKEPHVSAGGARYLFYFLCFYLCLLYLFANSYGVKST
jgi:hypothetical protein